MTYHNRRLDQDIPVPISATPAVVAGVGAVVAGDDGFVRFFDRSLRKVYWEHRLSSSVYASLVVDHRRRRVVVAGTDGRVVALDLRGGVGWSAELGSAVRATPAPLPGSDVLVVAAFGSRVLGLDLGSGRVCFDRPVPAPWHAAHGGPAAHRDPYASPVGTPAGSVVIGCAEHVLCLAPDGTELWRREIGRAVKASPAVLAATGEVAVCPVDGRCVFLDLATGAVTAEVFLGAQITGSPAVSGEVLAVGTRLGTVTGLDVRTRAPRWSSPQGAPRDHTSLTVLPDGNFVATTAGGNVVCLRATDGRFLWESSQVLGLPDHEPGMDITPVAAAGDMYCASYGGSLYRFTFKTVQPGGTAP